MFGIIARSPRDLSLHQRLEVTLAHLDNARNATDPTVALVFCHETEMSLYKLQSTTRFIANQKPIYMEIKKIYIGLGEVLDAHGHSGVAQAYYKESRRWDSTRSLPDPEQHSPSDH
ncbi:hypothetical protein B0O80DRAFT_431879 [Mortierella sp. GBAus27b]|nr:hypothetical protein B0O80DRAFT_431879 [Mortierella sp. GBAus27b]